MSPGPTLAVIDLGAVAENVRSLRAATNPQALVMAVVKANGYGHGAVRISRSALANGADRLGVARIEEAMHLRNEGISAPILVFGQVPEKDLPRCIEYDLTATAYSLPGARTISRIARGLGKKIRIHAKIDTGMGRLGLLPDAPTDPSAAAVRIHRLTDGMTAISTLPGIDLEGIYTHFATADVPGCRFAAGQLDLFLELLEALHLAGLDIPVRHAANSGALLHLPESHLDMVRPGISLYGLYPSPETDRTRISLRPAMTLKTRIIHLKKVPAGFPVSYGRTHITEAPTILATAAVGYADGYSRSLSNRGRMLVREKEAPVVGRICMDLSILDVGHIPDVALDDEVVVFGRQGDMEVSADDIATTLGSINYEVVTSVAGRIPREYHEGAPPEVKGQ